MTVAADFFDALDRYLKLSGDENGLLEYFLHDRGLMLAIMCTFFGQVARILFACFVR